MKEYVAYIITENPLWMKSLEGEELLKDLWNPNDDISGGKRRKRRKTRRRKSKKSRKSRRKSKNPAVVAVELVAVVKNKHIKT